mgnify:CR=1 FL=1
MRPSSLLRWLNDHFEPAAGISEPQQVAETFAPEFSDMHLQAAEDLRAEANRVKREALERAGASSRDAEQVPDVEATLKLAEILGKGGLPRIARLDVRPIFSASTSSSS